MWNNDLLNPNLYLNKLYIMALNSTLYIMTSTLIKLFREIMFFVYLSENFLFNYHQSTVVLYFSADSSCFFNFPHSKVFFYFSPDNGQTRAVFCRLTWQRLMFKFSHDNGCNDLLRRSLCSLYLPKQQLFFITCQTKAFFYLTADNNCLSSIQRTAILISRKIIPAYNNTFFL